MAVFDPAGIIGPPNSDESANYESHLWNHTPQQNGHIESFHNTLKREYIWPHDFANYQEAEAVIAEAFRDYNQDRLHSALRYVPPKEFLTSWE